MLKFFSLFILFPIMHFAQTTTPVWYKLEIPFKSDKVYDNVLYDVKSFNVEFAAPSGRSHSISGFWTGGKNWLVRFCPDEIGEWTWKSSCSDKKNAGLHNQTGRFTCVRNKSSFPIYQKGSIIRVKGRYHLAYADGTPFFWLACTAWNGALRSSRDDWDAYLQDRVQKGYSVIQFVTTQWRGCESNLEGEVAFTGSGRIQLNPEFFERIDERIDQINAHGLVAAPVLLWALPVGQGRELSPGYSLPQNEAILLGKYLAARYGGNQVVWILGGDGRYVNEYEQRWKNIGKGIFGGEHPGIVAQHPHGSSWIGEAYKDEHWLDVVGYQSSHSNKQRVVDWINKGPMANLWDKLPARPLMNLEPCYELIGHRITAGDVRNASYWSLFATPISGLTYGHNSIWPWLLFEGEKIQNHGNDAPYPSWSEAIHFPASRQIGYLGRFIQKFEWWNFVPAQELLVEQPGGKVFNHFIAIAKNPFNGDILAYLPVKMPIKIYNPGGKKYKAQWFNPVTNENEKAEPVYGAGIISVESTDDGDRVLVLRQE